MSPTPVIVNSTWTAGTSVAQRAISPSIPSISASSVVIWRHVLRRAGHLLSRDTDVRRWLTPEHLTALPASDRVILLSGELEVPFFVSRSGLRLPLTAVDVPGVQIQANVARH